MRLEEIFSVKRPIIGSLHFCPLIGYEEFPGIDFVEKKALADLAAFQNGGVDAVIIENNYDLPHRIKVGPETVAAMTFLALKLMRNTNLPLGIDVLWNDYEAALSIAKVAGLKFVRVAVFVDAVRTDFGDIRGRARDVVSYRARIHAQKVALFTDIQVKHATMLTPKKSIAISAKQAVKAGSDALVVTGRWTGDAPDTRDLSEARKAISAFPVIIGSGANEQNLDLLLQFVDGVIVSTSLKGGEYLSPEQNRNLKDFHEVVDLNKVRQFVRAFRRLSRRERMSP